MKATIHTSEPQLSEGDVEQLEAELRLIFPPAYRAFLLRYNGGYPNPNAFERESNNRKGRQLSMVADFFGIEDLRLYREMLIDRMPENLMPVACDSGGNMIVVSVAGKDVGHVYFWDHNRETEPPSYSNVYKAAPDFQSFLESLHDPDAP